MSRDVISSAEYCAAVEELPQPRGRVATWPVATIFPFVARPERYIFLKPEVTKKAADGLGFELNYKSEPNWLTYKSMLTLAAMLFDQLRPHGCRDFIDVQSFIWVAAEYDDPVLPEQSIR